MLDYLKKIGLILLTFTGILFIIRMMKSSEDFDDVTENRLTDEINQLESKLEDIQNTDYDIDSIVDDWNKNE